MTSRDHPEGIRIPSHQELQARQIEQYDRDLTDIARRVNATHFLKNNVHSDGKQIENKLCKFDENFKCLLFIYMQN